jgi:hypothetical protein
MPLRSDFTIHAETPDPPQGRETPEPRQAKTIRISWPGEEAEWPAGATTLTRHDLLSHLPEIGNIQEPFADEAAPQPEPVRRVAFLVVHGMGQQVPFETLSMLGQALLTQDDERKRKSGKAAMPPAAADDPRVSVRRVKLTREEGAPELSRVEVLFREKGRPPVDAHLYECYWAPLTEGQISFVQTVRFLYSAAWNGIWTYLRAKRKKGRTSGKPSDGLKHFDRWMFGQFRDMPIKRLTFWALLVTVLSVSVLLIPAILVFTPAGEASVRWLANHYKDVYLSWSWREDALAVAILGFVMGLAWWIRYFVVEYVGDVAIYVSSYKVSRFDAIRQKIQQAVRAVAHEIYSAGVVDHCHARYDEVVIVGHSLGSVIAYDALNEAINWDEAECGFSRKVTARTTRLITFGSPLDKTAFLFRTQVSSARNLREALAARQQPLILDYGRFRPRATFRWINIWSSRDYISGQLDYYDIAANQAKLPGNRPYGRRNPVINCIDPDARRPMLAHTQYWDNSKLHKVLYRAVWARARV